MRRSWNDWLGYAGVIVAILFLLRMVPYVLGFLFALPMMYMFVRGCKLAVPTADPFDIATAKIDEKQFFAYMGSAQCGAGVNSTPAPTPCDSISSCAINALNQSLGGVDDSYSGTTTAAPDELLARAAIFLWRWFWDSAASAFRFAVQLHNDKPFFQLVLALILIVVALAGPIFLTAYATRLANRSSTPGKSART